MSKIAIRAENLSKQYAIGVAGPSYGTLRDSLVDGLRKLLQRNSHTKFRRAVKRLYGQSTDATELDKSIWALKDISFEVKQGEVVGIIGRNGAGKSTLLKLLSRITEPTTGLAEIHGRVGALLDVGTGFHAELTGRENIYLNAAILGMKRVEIDRKFDEIVAFAEVEKFIDTPVKHYSSGMYLRLAFAVAAHLEPEILIVDEVLAVGDAMFQKKCLGKMENVTKEGRTVLFVSHSMTAIQSLCDRVLWLDAGKLIDEGPTQKVVQHYLQSTVSTESIPLDQRGDRVGDGSVRLVSFSIESTDPDKVIRPMSCLKVTLHYRSERPLRSPIFMVEIYDYTNVGIFVLNSDAVGGFPEVLPPEGCVACLTAPISLTPGRCYINLVILKGAAVADYVEHAGEFDVEADDVYGSGKVPSRDWVLCVLKHEWLIEDV